jgi:uncharacterized protein (TIGR02646 family)
MITINKRNEPASWTQYRSTPGVAYQATEELRQALLVEQGFICAYCMRRIPVKDSGNIETTRIDHIKSRTDNPNLELDYGNMVICCPGFIDSNEHCDKSKGDSEITFSLFNINLQKSISYSSKDGSIKSSNPVWDSEIKDIVRLNNNRLKLNRLQTLDGLRSALEKGKWRTSELETKLILLSNPDDKGKFTPYCGISIWYLKKKLRN